MGLSNLPGESMKTARFPGAELSRLNAELRRENDELSSLLESAQIPILVVDKDLRLRRFTSAAATAFELQPSDTGKPLRSVPLALQLPELKNEIAKVLDGLQAAAMEVQDRQGRWYALGIRPHRTGEHGIDGVTLSLIDFTEKRARLRALDSASAQAEAALDAFNISTAILDSSLTILLANKRFYESFNSSASKACGRTLFQLSKRMWNAPSLRDKLEALRRDEAPFDYEGDFFVPEWGVSRTLTLHGRVVARRPEAGNFLLVAFEDETLRKIAAETAAQRKSEGRQREFVANVSHELMTPITAIKGYSEALVTGALEIPGKRLKFTQIIEKHADRLAQLVEDILVLSTFEAGQKKSTDIVPLAGQFQKLLLGLTQMARKRGISVRVKVAPALKVTMNKSELNRVLQNLVANAIKYNRAKGRIAITARAVGKRVVVSISDTGIGVPKEDLSRIFDRFHRAANARAKTERGTGLGLSIVKSILDSHGCRIWAESALDKGTTFFFTLPKA